VNERLSPEGLDSSETSQEDSSRSPLRRATDARKAQDADIENQIASLEDGTDTKKQLQDRAKSLKAQWNKGVREYGVITRMSRDTDANPDLNEKQKKIRKDALARRAAGIQERLTQVLDDFDFLQSDIDAAVKQTETQAETQASETTEDRVRRIFDTDNPVPSLVAEGEAVDTSTPKGAQILKQRVLEVVKDVLEKEYPGATSVDAVETEAEAAAKVPKGVPVEGQEGIMYFDGKDIRVVLIGENIEAKQFADGTPADSSLELLRNAVRDGVRIFFHESIGHAGLRQAFGGDEGALQAFFERLYNSKRQSEIDKWGQTRYETEDWAAMSPPERAEEWTVQTFVEEGVRPSGVMDTLRLFFGANKESSDAAIRKLVSNIHDSLRRGEKPTIVSSPSGAMTATGEDPVTEDLPEFPEAPEAEAPTTPPPTAESPAPAYAEAPTPTAPAPAPAADIEEMTQTLQDKWVDLPSQSMVSGRTRIYERDLSRPREELTPNEAKALQARINAAQADNDLLLDLPDLTKEQKKRVRSNAADIMALQGILSNTPTSQPTSQETAQETAQGPVSEPTSQGTAQETAQETAEEAALSGPAIRLRGRRIFSDRGPEETQEVVGYFRGSSGRLPKVKTLENMGVDRKVAEDVIDKGAVVIRWDRLKAGETVRDQDLWGGQSFPLLDMMQENGIAGASKDAILNSVINFAMENRTPYVIVELMGSTGVDGNQATLPTYIDMLEEQISDMSPTNQKAALETIVTRLIDKVGPSAVTKLAGKKVHVQAANNRNPFRPDKETDRGELFKGLSENLKQFARDRGVKPAALKEPLFDAVQAVRMSDFAKGLSRQVAEGEIEATDAAQQIFERLVDDPSLGGVLKGDQVPLMKLAVDTKVQMLEAAKGEYAEAEGVIDKIMTPLPKREGVKKLSAPKLMEGLRGLVENLKNSTFENRATFVRGTLTQTLADSLNLPSPEVARNELQERTDIPEGGAVQVIQLPFPQKDDGSFDFFGFESKPNQAKERAKQEMVTTGEALGIAPHPSYSHYMKGKFLGRFDRVIPKDVLMSKEERDRGNASQPKFTDKLINDKESQKTFLKSIGDTGALVSPAQELLLDYVKENNWTESKGATPRETFNKHLRQTHRTRLLPSIFMLSDAEMQKSRIFALGPTDNLEQGTGSNKETVRPAVRVAIVQDSENTLRVKGISTLERDSGNLPMIAGLLKSIDVLGETRQTNPKAELIIQDVIGEDNSALFKLLGFIKKDPKNDSKSVNPSAKMAVSEKRALRRVLEGQGIDLSAEFEGGSEMTIGEETFYLPPVNTYQWTGDDTNGTDAKTFYQNFLRDERLGLRGTRPSGAGGVSRSSTNRGRGERYSEAGGAQRPTANQAGVSETSGAAGERDASSLVLRFSSAYRPLQNNPQGASKPEKAGRGALRAVRSFFDHKIDLPEREFFEELKQTARGQMSRYVEAGRDLGNLFMKAKPEEQALIYQYLTDAQQSAASIPVRQIGRTDLRQASIDAKQRIEQIGEDLVRLGMLDPYDFESRRGQYLPRVYLKHLFSEEHQKILSSGGSLKTSDLGYLKKRKDIDALVRESVLGEIKSPGYLVSRVLMQSGQDVARLDFLKAVSQNKNWVLPESHTEISYGAEIEAILDANPDLRRQLLDQGLPPAARQTAPRTVTSEYLASEARRLRETVLPNRTGAVKELTKELINVFEDKVAQARGSQDYDALKYTKLPDSARYGDLRGAIVRNEIYDEFVGSAFGNNQSKIEESLNVLTSFLKFSLTAANPVVWANNLRSNTAMMHFAGLPVHRNPQYRLKAFREVVFNRSRYRAFKDQGLTLSTFAANELGKLETKLIRSLSDADRKLLSRPLSTSKPALAAQGVLSFFYNRLGDLYQMMEVIDKLALGMYLEDHGPSTGVPLANGKKMTTAQAMREANEWLFDYSDVPETIRRGRRSLLGAPFITWIYKATPKLAGMMKSPRGMIRAATWYSLLYMAMMQQEADLDDEEYDAYYASLPDWLAQREYFSVPLPMKDENGKMVTEDYTMFAPHATLLNLGTTALGDMKGLVVDDEQLTDRDRRFNMIDEVKTLGFGSHPALESSMEALYNRDSFTNKPIYYETDTTGETARKITEHFGDNLFPQLIAPNGVVRRLIEHMADDPNVFGPAKILDNQGNPTRTLAQEVRRINPLVPNQYPTDPKNNLKWRRKEIEDAMRERRRQYKATRSKYRGDKGVLDELREEYQEDMNRLKRLLREFPKASDLPRLKEYEE